MRHAYLVDDSSAGADDRSDDQARREVVSMLAHDIRGMLSAVGSAVEMARLDLEDVPAREAHRFLEIADRNIVDLLELTTNLLDCFRLDEGRLAARREPVDLAALAADIVERLSAQAAHRRIAVVVQGDPLERVLGDADLLRRVLMNLVANALKFSPPGGHVVVELDAPLRPPSGRAGVAVAVRDDGPGLSAEQQAHLFERFSPLARPGGGRPVGVGLGLAFCRGALALMDGEIWVESQPGHGSTFAFLLPAAEAGTRDARDARATASDHAGANGAEADEPVGRRDGRLAALPGGRAATPPRRISAGPRRVPRRPRP